MKLSFGNNILSLGVQRYLSDASQSLGQRYERLSSGQRINRASDDAAGLSIADRLRTDATLSSGAYRNINDGISLLNVASGTLDQQTAILFRLQELAQQSATGTYSNNQRQSLAKEYRQLIEEFGRLGSSTSFNGVKLLAGIHNGTPANLFLQAGITGDRNSLLSLQNSNTGSFSGRFNYSGLPFGIDLYLVGGTESLVMANHNGQIARLGSFNGREVYAGFYANGYGTIDVNFWEKESNGNFNPIHSFTFNYDTSTGVVASNGSGSAAVTYANGQTGSVNYDFRGLEIYSSVGLGAPLGSSGNSNLDFTSISFASYSLTALDTVRRRLDDLNVIKGQIGALQSRLNIASQISLITRETSVAAESRIRDADIAEESAGLMAATIRQQTSSVVLKQANKAPELLLQLLKSA